MKAGRPAAAHLVAFVTGLAAGSAWAQGGEAAHARSGWTVDLLVAPALLVTGVLYARGAWVLWRGRDLVHGLKGWQAWCFAAGCSAVAVALLSPLERASEVHLAAHVLQLELLMLVAAPLLVLGRPWVPMLWALPLETRRRLVAKLRTRPVVRAWRLVTHPLFIVLAHAAALWGWHVPALFEAALRSELVQALQHASLLFTAALLFQSLVYGRHARIGPGAAAAGLVVTAVHSALLCALLDQRLAGLLMGVVFTGFAVVVLRERRRVVTPSAVEQLPSRRGPTTKTGP